MTTPAEEVKPKEPTLTEVAATNQQPEISQDEAPDNVNWKQFREKREQERKERDEYAKRLKYKEEEAKALKEALEAVISKKPTHSEGDEETEEQRISRIVKNQVEQESARRESARKEAEAKDTPNRLRKDHGDFDRVVTEENLDYLEYHYPEIAATYKELPDGYTKWSNLYKTVKKLIPNVESKNDQKKIEKNLAKPPSLSSPAVASPEAGGPRVLTEAMKQANWERMRQSLKNAD